MRCKPQAHIERIRKDFHASQRVKDSLNNSIQTLSQDLYSKETHFIFELIQNAEDNTYKNDVEPSLCFNLVKNDPTGTPNATGALIVQNNEIGFTYENVDAICAIGKSTKSKIQGYIGEKGIGFKSVFRITTIPHIFSNGYQFCFPEKDKETGLGYIVPQWITKVPPQVDPGQTTIILPLNKPDFSYERVKDMLQDIKLETILFLSKLKEIQIRTDSGDDLIILKDDSKNPHIQLLIEGRKQGKLYSNIREFLLFTKTFDRPRNVSHEKRSGVDKRNVTIAFPIDDNKDSMGKIFAYLPVRSDTGFPFLINADFILPSSREDIQDIPWNRWLMDCVANLLAHVLPLLKEEGLLTVELLEALAKRTSELNKSDIFYPIADAVRNALMNEKLLPADDGTFVSANNARLAESDELRKLLSPEQLKELFSIEEDVKWLSAEITERKTPELWSYLTKSLNVKAVTGDSFARRITKDFLKKQSIEWMITFYRFLNKQRALWKYPASPLYDKPFIRLQDGTLVSPFKDSVYLPPEGDTKFPIVSREIAKDEEVLDFLRKGLELREPNIIAEVIQYIIPKYTQDSSNLSSDEHMEDIEKILSAFSEASYEERESLRMKLRDVPFILAENYTLCQIGYKKPHQLYLPNDELIIYFNGNKNIWFVKSDHYKQTTLELFKTIGVADEIRVRCRSKGYLTDRIKLESKYEYGYTLHRCGLRGFDPDIRVDGLKHAISNPSIKRSEIVWNKIALRYSHCIRGIIIKSSRQDFSRSAKIYEEEEIISDFGDLLMNSEWLPDKEGRFHKPARLQLDDLPESFERDERLADQLGMDRDIMIKLAEKAKIPLNVLAQAKKIAESPPEVQKQIDSLLSKYDPNKSEFPRRTPADPERRQERLLEQLEEALERRYEQRNRSIRITANSIDKEIYLRNSYTNENDQMVCQICKNEMPFKKRNGEYYFEAVEILSRDYLSKEHEAQYLALCPLCAAKYKEFIKRDEDAMRSLAEALIETNDLEIPILLGEESETIRFVETHISDIKTILKASRESM